MMEYLVKSDPLLQIPFMERLNKFHFVIFVIQH